jgi:predicted SAM-dependent methyltransferase
MKNRQSTIVRTIKHFLVDIRIRVQARRSPRRVMIGSANVSQAGWVKTDIGHLNIMHEKDWVRYFAKGSIDALLAEHVLEHLTMDECRTAARTCYIFLKRGGYFRIAVPDGNFPDQEYIEHVRPMGSGPGADDHKVLYTVETLSVVFESAGFVVKALEYWDADGVFHCSPWKPEDGFILRSRWNQSRNSGQTIKYTSIILDAIKP